MKELRIGNLVAKLPIVQGGMGVGVSLSSLSSAVANAGGIGVISVAGIGANEDDFYTHFIEANIRALKKEIRKAREMTKGILGVNIMAVLTNFVDMVKVSIEEGIDIIFSGAGLPLNLPKFLKGRDGPKLAPIVSSARAAGLITKRWFEKHDYIPDAVVVEGPLAGGHLGFSEEQITNEDFALEKLVPEVIGEMKPWENQAGRPVPVIAAGGIYDGKDIYKFLKLGAAGVQMATRFVTTDECDASREFKEAYIRSEKKDIQIISSPVGLPGRAIDNTFLEDVRNGKKHPLKCHFHCIRTCDLETSPYCIAHALINAKRGQLDHGFAFTGENAYRTDEIIPVAELVNKLKDEYHICQALEGPASKLEGE